MAAHSMPVEPALPERPTTVELQDALNAVETRGFLGSARYCAQVLAAEVQHLHKLGEDDGWSWGSLYVQVLCVNDAWSRVDHDELATDYPDLAGELDELGERADGTTLTERRLAAMGDVVAAARAMLELNPDTPEPRPQGWIELMRTVDRLDHVIKGGA